MLRANFKIGPLNQFSTKTIMAMALAKDRLDYLQSSYFRQKNTEDCVIVKDARHLFSILFLQPISEQECVTLELFWISCMDGFSGTVLRKMQQPN